MRPTAFALLFVLTLPALAPGGQQQPAPPAPAAEAAAASGDLPVSFARIRRQLAAPARPKPIGILHLEYYLEVYGKKPVFDMLKGVDLQNGPVPYGGPTHQEFLNLVTPQAFRAPAANLMAPLTSLVDWLQKRAKEREQRQKP